MTAVFAFLQVHVCDNDITTGKPGIERVQACTRSMPGLLSSGCVCILLRAFVRADILACLSSRTFVPTCVTFCSFYPLCCNVLEINMMMMAVVVK